MNCSALLAKIDELQPRYLAYWTDICSIESPTSHKPGVDAVGAYCIAHARAMGWTVEVHEEDVAGNAVCITMNPDASGAPICLSGHMDTVHPVGSFGSPAVRIEGEKLCGPGVVDCKGGIAAAALAMDALAQCGFTARPVKLLLQSDEEGGSRWSDKRTIGWICEQAKDAALFLNAEGFGGKAVLQRKGILNYRFTVHGRSCHGSKCHEGASAIAEAAHKILALEQWKDGAGLTANCGTIEGGTTPNTVPETCSFVVNIRFATAEQRDFAEAECRRIAESSSISGTTCTLERVSYRIAMERADRNFAALDRMNAIYADAGLPTLVAGASTGGSDAADVTAAGIPCVDSVGTRGGGIHTVNEYAYIASLAESAKRMASVIWCW
ncbi:MAG: M20/M25/M40 family metallo-hydrolase [Clostridia bacterium]|nr:M20/M25/M40 family metallo-hydrolase [Clostridia bacterium]